MWERRPTGPRGFPAACWWWSGSARRATSTSGPRASRRWWRAGGRERQRKQRNRSRLACPRPPVTSSVPTVSLSRVRCLPPLEVSHVVQLRPESFLGWYREHASLLQRFFGPLQIAAFALAAVAAALRWFVRGSASPFLVLATLLAFAVLVAFPLYFERVNGSFAAGTIAPVRVPEELRR